MTPDMERLSEIAQDTARTWGHRIDDQTAEAVVRAVLRAVRDPSPSMVDRGESAASAFLCKPTDDRGVPYLFREMIDHVLGAES